MKIQQTGHFEPVIHHAIVGLGALHERFMLNNGMIRSSDYNTCKDNFAVQHYNYAIRSLVSKNGDKTPAMDVCLTACILFACFEVTSLLSSPLM